MTRVQARGKTRARDQWRGKRDAHFDSYGHFDIWRNIALATIIQAIEDLDSNSPSVRLSAYLWLNGQDAYDLCLELACENDLRNFLLERGLILQLLVYNNPEERKVIPLFLGKDAGQQL